MNEGILRTAAIELQTLDSKDVVKVAGVVRRIRNWWRAFNNPEYSRRVSELKQQSAAIKYLIDTLGKEIDGLQSSIDDSDVYTYEQKLALVKQLSATLSEQLGNYHEATVAAEQAVPVENVSVPDETERVEFGAKINRPVQDFPWFKQYSPSDVSFSDRFMIEITKRMAGAAARAVQITGNESQDIAKYALLFQSPDVINQLYQVLPDAVLNGALLKYQKSPASKEVKNRPEGQHSAFIQTKSFPITLPAIEEFDGQKQFMFNALCIMTDMRSATVPGQKLQGAASLHVRIVGEKQAHRMDELRKLAALKDILDALSPTPEIRAFIEAIPNGKHKGQIIDLLQQNPGLSLQDLRSALQELQQPQATPEQLVQNLPLDLAQWLLFNLRKFSVKYKAKYIQLAQAIPLIAKWYADAQPNLLNYSVDQVFAEISAISEKEHIDPRIEKFIWNVPEPLKSYLAKILPTLSPTDMTAHEGQLQQIKQEPGRAEQMMQDSIGNLVDWFQNSDVKISKYPLDKAGFKQMLGDAEHWHRMICQNYPSNDYDPIDSANIVYGPRWENPDDNGWFIIELKSENDLAVEGKKLKHCVGTYWNSVKKGNTRIFSLRDSQNNPHVTIALNPSATIVREIHGKSNAAPGKKEKQMIDEWLGKFKRKITDEEFDNLSEEDFMELAINSNDPDVHLKILRNNHRSLLWLKYDWANLADNFNISPKIQEELAGKDDPIIWEHLAYNPNISPEAQLELMKKNNERVSIYLSDNYNVSPEVQLKLLGKNDVLFPHLRDEVIWDNLAANQNVSPEVQLKLLKDGNYDIWNNLAANRNVSPEVQLELFGKPRRQARDELIWNNLSDNYNVSPEVQLKLLGNYDEVNWQNLAKNSNIIPEAQLKLLEDGNEDIWYYLSTNLDVLPEIKEKAKQKFNQLFRARPRTARASASRGHRMDELKKLSFAPPTNNIHTWAKGILTQAFTEEMGRPPTSGELQAALAVAYMETNYGKGWTGKRERELGITPDPRARTSNNWGAIQTTTSKPPDCGGSAFRHIDTHPDGKVYTTCFMAYSTPLDGARDLIRVLYKTSRGPALLQAAESGSVLDIAKVMYDTHYYEGSGATREQRIAGRAAGMNNILKLISKNTGDESSFQLQDKGSRMAYLQQLKEQAQKPEQTQDETYQALTQELFNDGTQAPNETPNDAGVAQDYQTLIQQLFASNAVETFVRTALERQFLPEIQSLIVVGSSQFPFMVRYAHSLASALRTELGAEVSVHSDGNKIEIECDAHGPSDAVLDAVQGLTDGISNAFELASGFKINGSVVPDARSEMNILDAATSETNFRKYAFRMMDSNE